MSQPLRVLSYNVRSLRDDGRAVAAVIRGCAPDLVCVQEAPRFLRWRSRCAELARRSRLVVVTGGRPAGAMLVLARLGVDVVEARDVLLSKAPGLHQRGLAVAVLRLGGAQIVVASIHLDLEAGQRRRHVEEVFARLDAPDRPIVLAGDVNEEPGAPAWSALTARLQDGYAVAPVGEEYTYSARQPHKRIDGVFVDRRLRVLSCGVPDVAGMAAASDHRPVLAVLEVPDPVRPGQ